VHEAEAQAVSSAREYDALKDRTAAEIKDLFTMAVSQRELVKLFRSDIVPKSEQTLEVSFEAYCTGQTDFPQLLDNWRELLKHQIMLHEQECQLRPTLSTLKRVIVGAVPSAAAADPTASEMGLDVPQPQPIPGGSPRPRFNLIENVRPTMCHGTKSFAGWD
jgi:outer membrane protein TolC